MIFVIIGVFTFWANLINECEVLNLNKKILTNVVFLHEFVVKSEVNVVDFL